MLKKQEVFALGFMTFALFLGAGNVVFAPLMGAQAGENLLEAMLGFLLTGVGLPAMTLITLAAIGGSAQLTDKLPKNIALIFWIILFLMIGPLFAIPRSIAVANTFAAEPFFGQDALLIFSILFTGMTLILSWQPGKLLDRIGKVLTPLLLLLLSALTFAAYFYPLGHPSSATNEYIHHAFSEGILQGYMTMDTLGAIGFGWIIYATIKSLGVESKKQTAYYTLIAALIYVIAMSSVYFSLAWIGASSASALPGSITNGGSVLTYFTQQSFGIFGNVMLGTTMALACLTTNVGLTATASEYFTKRFPKLSYRFCIITIALLSCVIANFGLEALLDYTTPVVVILYPIAISILALAPWRFILSQAAMVQVLLSATLFGCIDAAHLLEKMPSELNHLCELWLPLYAQNASWLLPTGTLLLLNLGYHSLKKFQHSRSLETAVE